MRERAVFVRACSSPNIYSLARFGFFSTLKAIDVVFVGLRNIRAAYERLLESKKKNLILSLVNISRAKSPARPTYAEWWWGMCGGDHENDDDDDDEEQSLCAAQEF